MKYIDADLLRKEIERRLKYTHDWLRGDEKRHPNQTFISKNYYKMKGDERTLDALLNFLGTLSEEPDKNLEEAAEEYAGDSTGFIDMTAYRAFIAGAEWQKSQMLKDAVEYKIVNNLAAYPVIYYEVNHLGLKYGDKVRLVVLKAEEE